MMRLNNKGQSLVLFILLIPIILGIMALVFDLGNALVKKNEIDNVIEMVLDDYFKNTYIDNSGINDTTDDTIDDTIIDGTTQEDNTIIIEDKALTSTDNNTKKESLEVLLTYNLIDIETNIDINDEYIMITGKTYVEGIFSNILSIKGFRVESEYKGYLESKDIEKIK